jgi:hypothetical protein
VDEGRAGAGEDGSEQLGAVQEQLGAVQRQLSVGNTLANRELILEAIALHQRYIERLPTSPFSLVLCKEYFGCPQRDSHAVHYI